MELPEQSIVRTLSLSSIRQDLKLITETPEAQISTLDSGSPLYQTYTRLYNNIRDYYQTASPSEYQHDIVEYIKGFPRPMNIYPGTLGAFVFGCLYDTANSGNIFCSPACANSIPPSNTIEVEPCVDQVWYVRDGVLSYRSGTGRTASVFGKDGALTKAEAKTLYDSGVRVVKVFSPRGALIDTEELPRGASVVSAPAVTPTPAVAPLQAIAVAGTTGWSRGPVSLFSDWKFLLILVVGLIALGVLIYFLVQYMRSKPEDQVPVKSEVTATT